MSKKYDDKDIDELLKDLWDLDKCPLCWGDMNNNHKKDPDNCILGKIQYVLKRRKR